MFTYLNNIIECDNGNFIHSKYSLDILNVPVSFSVIVKLAIKKENESLPLFKEY